MTKFRSGFVIACLTMAMVTLTFPGLSCPSSTCAAETYKQLPPSGIEIEAADLRKLQGRIKTIRSAYDHAAEKATLDGEAWKPHVEALVRAVDLAIEHNGFFKAKEVEKANQLLDEAERRIKTISRSKNTLQWLGLSPKPSDKPQLLVGGFRSTIDDSVQPFGMVIPADFDASRPHRLDLWLHGRGDTKTELVFLNERQNRIGDYAPKNTVVLHPFGRHCNAFKFAGETDVYEALDAAKRLVSVDDDRIALRGFSMGGAAVWHIAAHDPARWFAVNPGAGFVDTIVYQNWSEKKPYPITGMRQKLLQIYDVLPWASNLQNTRLVAYSGEVDKQRQAAERVTDVLSQRSIPFEHVIGAGMAHKIDDASKDKVNALLERYVDEVKPKMDVSFVTYHLRHHQAAWLSVEGLVQHYHPGEVHASVKASGQIRIKADGVNAMTLDTTAMNFPKPETLNISINDQLLEPWTVDSDGKLDVSMSEDGRWRVGPLKSTELRKRPGIQGPIDDAFYGRFLFVVPSRPAAHGTAQRFIDREMKYAAKRWKTLMRGDVRWVKDSEVTEQDIRESNLICFGDFSSNQYLAKIAGGLPIEWTKEKMSVGKRSFDAATSVAVFCYPNPENPQRYVVANSGMTFREFSNVSNSRQIAMLGDWAIFNADSADDGIFAGEILAEGIFNEAWQIPATADQ